MLRLRIQTNTWRTKSISTIFLQDPQDVRSNDPGVFAPGTTISVGGWNSGGHTAVSRVVCKWQNGSGFLFRRSIASIYQPAAMVPPYILVSAQTAIQIINVTPEIDWESIMATVRASYNPDSHVIAAVRLCDPSGNGCVDLTKDGHINLKGTCSRCKEWVEQLHCFKEE